MRVEKKKGFHGKLAEIWSNMQMKTKIKVFPTNWMSFRLNYDGFTS